MCSTTIIIAVAIVAALVAAAALRENYTPTGDYGFCEPRRPSKALAYSRSKMLASADPRDDIRYSKNSATPARNLRAIEFFYGSQDNLVYRGVAAARMSEPDHTPLTE